MTCSIAWYDFSWEAFATLVTGLSAVLAAVYVARKQSEIQKVQVGLQSLTLRSDLFDRRYGVYDRVQNFVFEIVNSLDFPSDDVHEQFKIARGEAKFLFDENVLSGLNEISDRAYAYRRLKQEMHDSYLTTGSYGIGRPQQEQDAKEWFHQRLQSLPDMFASMRLGG